jgi:hypothetical protein
MKRDRFQPSPPGHSQFGRAMTSAGEVILTAACLALIAFFSWAILHVPDEFAHHSERAAGVLIGAAVAQGELP